MSPRLHVLVALAAATLSGCAGEAPESIAVLGPGPDGYAVRARSLPELTDVRRLDGELGTGWRGGVLRLTEYRRGGRLDIEYVVHEGVGTPLYDDGLVLWSFYAHLADARRDLLALGHDLSPIFPVDIAFAPLSILDFAAVENAAYAPGSHTFALFPEVLSDGVPLAANAGVVRHELGHAWFSLVVADLEATAPYDDDLAAAERVRALGEGFADIVATVSLDDPAFLAPSLSMPARDVTGTAQATADLYPDPEADLLGSLLWDPYALGTVFASLAWDLRVAGGQEETLAAAIAALEAWRDEGRWDDIDRYAVLLVEAFQDVDGPAACAALAYRFPDVEEPDACAR